MAPHIRRRVPVNRWNRLRAKLPPSAIAAGDAAGDPSATVDGYRADRFPNAAAFDGALLHLSSLLGADLGAIGERWEKTARVFATALAPAASGSDSERAEHTREGVAEALALVELMRACAMRAEALGEGLLLRAEDHERPMEPGKVAYM